MIVLNSEKNSTDDDVLSDRSEPFEDSESEYEPSNHSEQKQCTEESEENTQDVVEKNLRKGKQLEHQEVERESDRKKNLEMHQIVIEQKINVKK